MPPMIDPLAAQMALADRATSWSELNSIAQLYPEWRVKVASHPNVGAQPVVSRAH